MANPNPLSALASPGAQQLFVAAKQGDMLALTSLLAEPNAGEFLSCKNEEGETALHIAAKRGHNDFIDALLEDKRCSVDAKDNSGKTALHAAAKLGLYHCCKALIKQTKLSIQAKNGYTALHYAVANKQHNIITLFLEHLRTDEQAHDILLIKENIGRTPLAFAKVIKDEKSIKLLEQEKMRRLLAAHNYKIEGDGQDNKRANKQVEAISTPNTDGYALRLAAIFGDKPRLDVLLANPEVKKQINDANTITHTPITRRGEEPETPNLIQHNTALSLAAEYGHAELVKTLLQVPGIYVNGETPNIKATNNGTYSPLHKAAKYNHLECVKLLTTDSRVNINAGARMTASVIASGGVAFSPIGYAAAYGHTRIVEHLLGCKGINLDGLPFTAMVMYGHYDVVNLLVNDNRITLGPFKKSALRQEAFANALINAVRKNDPVKLQALLNLPGAPSALYYVDKTKPNITVYGGASMKMDLTEYTIPEKTALELAVDRGHITCVEMLIADKRSHLSAEQKTRFLNNAYHAALFNAVKADDVNALNTLLADPRASEFINAPLKGEFDPVAQTLLFKAAMLGSLDCLERLLRDKRIDITVTNELGETCLHAPLQTGNVKALDFLLRHDRIEASDTNSSNSSGETPLIAAVRHYWEKIAMYKVTPPAVTTQYTSCILRLLRDKRVKVHPKCRRSMGHRNVTALQLAQCDPLKPSMFTPNSGRHYKNAMLAQQMKYAISYRTLCAYIDKRASNPAEYYSFACFGTFYAKQRYGAYSRTDKLLAATWRAVKIKQGMQDSNLKKVPEARFNLVTKADIDLLAEDLKPETIGDLYKLVDSLTAGTATQAKHRKTMALKCLNQGKLGKASGKVNAALKGLQKSTSKAVQNSLAVR